MSSAAYAAGLLAAIAAPSAAAKASAIAALTPPPDGELWAVPDLPQRPGREAHIVEGQAPRRRRGLAHEGSRLRFLHAIWHIECSAIDLALVCSLRGPGMPAAFHADQLQVAAEEAVHAGLVADLLERRGFAPGSDPVHHRLWATTRACADLGEQLVVVPRFLEARGLDVNADLLPRLAGLDDEAHAVLARIYQDEIGHVGIGTRWHRQWCQQRGLDPEVHFQQVVARHGLLDHPSPAPLDRAGRRSAGFSDRELESLRG